MSRLLAGTVILEGITHIEDLPLEKFIDTVENIKDKIVTEKLDGANLWFGVDENGFFTSREGKSKKNSRFYSVDDYPMVASYNGFRSAHLALEKVKNTILKVLQDGDMVEIEVLFGRQPNTVTYGANDLNYIVILRGIGTDPKKVDLLANKLDNTQVTVTSDVISSDDGDQLKKTSDTADWEFTQVKPVDNSKINSSEAGKLLSDLKRFLDQKNDLFGDMTNQEVAEIKLGSVDKSAREEMKKARELTLAKIMSDYKLPIKEILLNNYVRKIKPKLQTGDLDPSEDVGVEGVVLRDKDTDDQVKIVDKDVFTAINTFNNLIRSSVSGLVRTDDQEASTEMRGGAFGNAKIRIAQLLGIKELAMSSQAKRTLEKFKGADAEETANNVADSINLTSFESTKEKINAILSNAIEEVDEILATYKNEADTYKLKLKTGKEIGISPEIMKRNLTAFAETKRDIRQISQAVSKSETPAQLIASLYGRTIQSLFKGSNEVKESFTLLRTIAEDEGGMPAGVPVGVPAADSKATTTTSADIATNPQNLLGKNIIKRQRGYTRPKKFAKPTNESILRLVEFDVMNQNATDVDDTVSAQNDVEFKQLRNTMNSTDNLTDADVTNYLDKAHELNDEVDTIAFGMELDDGSIVKVYVNATQAEGFEQALAQMLGEYDDIEEVIDTLANTYDIVDVEWPQDMQPTTQVGVDPSTDPNASNAAVIDSNLDQAPDVNPVIDLGDTEDFDDDAQTVSTDGDEQDGEGLTIDTTFFDNDSNDIDMGSPIDDEMEDDATASGGEDDVDMSSDDEPAVDLGDEESPDAAGDDELEVVGGEVASDEEETPDETGDTESKPKSSDDEDEEESEEEAGKSKKKEESMTIGQQFKAKLLAEKVSKKPKNGEEDTEQKLDITGIPAEMDKLLQSFPTRGDKAMLVLLYALGAPIDAMSLKKADLRKSVEEAGMRHNKDSQFRLWVKRLTEELFKAKAAPAEAALEDELGNAMQRMVLEIMQKVGLTDSVERLARATLRTNIRNVAKIALSNSKVRQFIKMVAEMLGIDATTGMVKEADSNLVISWKNASPSDKAYLKKLGLTGDKIEIAEVDDGEGGEITFARVDGKRYRIDYDKNKAIMEAKNHMGEAEQTTYAGWKRAVKAAFPDAWFEGDKEIGNAFIGAKPFAKGKTVGVGEWDGEKGSVYKKEDVAKHKITETAAEVWYKLKIPATAKKFLALKNADKLAMILGTEDDVSGTFNDYQRVSADYLDDAKITGDIVRVWIPSHEASAQQQSKMQKAFDDWLAKVESGKIKITTLEAAAPGVTAGPSADDQTGNEWVDEIMKLAETLGIPADILNYRRKQTEMALKQSRTKMQNYSLVLRNIKKLNQIIGNNTK